MNKFTLSFLTRQINQIIINGFVTIFTEMGEIRAQYVPCSEEFKIVNGCAEWSYTFCAQDSDLPSGMDVCSITADMLIPPYLMAIPPIFFEDSDTTTFTGAGTETNPYQVNVTLDPDPNNGMEVRANGIFMETASGTDGTDGVDGTGLPIGSVIWIAGTAPPTGMLALSGQLVLRVDYAALWTFAQASGNLSPDASWEGGQFSDGNGTTNFRLPDVRGEFVRGWDNGKGTDAGRAIGTEQDFAIENIEGEFRLANADANTFSGAFQTNGSNVGFQGGNFNNGNVERVGFDASNSVNTAAETRPRNLSLLGCIQAL